MNEYFYVYAGLWTLALLHSARPSARPGLIFGLQGVVLAGFAALRFETGYDWPVYGAHYNGTAATVELMFEPGYELLVAAFVHLGIEFKYYLSVLSVCMVAALMVVLRSVAPKYKEIAMAVAFSMPDFFLIPVFSVIRQTLSLLILMLGFVCYRAGRKRIGRMLIALSFFFHYSTFFIYAIVLVFRWLRVSDKNYWRMFAFFSICYLLSVDVFRYVLNLIIEFVVPNYSYYLNKDTFNASMPYRAVTAVVSGLMVWLVTASSAARGAGVPNNNSFARHASMLSLILPIVFFNFPTFTSRFLFLGAFSIIGYALLSLTEVLRVTRVLICVLLSFALVLPLYRFLSSPYSSPYVPYQSMVSYDESNSTGGERTQELLDMLDSLW
jgi:hypothetical protein